MKPFLARYYHAFDNAETALAALSRDRANTDYDWEAILGHSFSTVLARTGQPFSAADVGGHLGVHTDRLLALESLRRVDCFEPIPAYAKELARRYRGDRRVRVRRLALGRQSARCDFVVNATAPGESGLRQRSFYNDPDAKLSTITVRCRRLDQFRFRRLAFIKIDTEGAELDILAGGTKTLARHRPLISLEFGIGGFDAYGYQPADLTAFAAQHGLTLTDLFFNACAPETFADRICSRFYWDYFLVPNEMLPAITALKRDRTFN